MSNNNFLCSQSEDLLPLKSFYNRNQSFFRPKKNNICLVVPTFNQKHVIAKLLELMKLGKENCDLIVVDNCSSDGTTEYLSQLKWPHLSVIKAKKNFGGSGAQYIGCRYAYEKRYEIIVLSDNDAFPVTKGILSGLQEAFEVYPNAACVCPRNICDLRSSIKKLNKRYSVIESTGFTFAAFKREVVSKVGFPDFRYFLTFDDTDYMFAVKKTAGEVIQANNLLVYHEGAKFKSYFSAITGYFYTRNVFLLLNKEYIPLKDKLVFASLYIFLIPFLRVFYFLCYSKNKKIKFIDVILKGFLDGLRKSFYSPPQEFLNSDFFQTPFIKEVSIDSIKEKINRITILGRKEDIATINKKLPYIKNKKITFVAFINNNFFTFFSALYGFFLATFNKKVYFFINVRNVAAKLWLFRHPRVFYFLLFKEQDLFWLYKVS